MGLQLQVGILLILFWSFLCFIAILTRNLSSHMFSCENWTNLCDHHKQIKDLLKSCLRAIKKVPSLSGINKWSFSWPWICPHVIGVEIYCLHIILTLILDLEFWLILCSFTKIVLLGLIFALWTGPWESQSSREWSFWWWLWLLRLHFNRACIASCTVSHFHVFGLLCTCVLWSGCAIL